MSKRHYISVCIALLSLPALAEDPRPLKEQVRDNVHQAGEGIIGVGAADLGVQAYKIGKTAGPAIARGNNFNLEYDRLEQAKYKVEKELAGDLRKELDSVNDQLVQAKKHPEKFNVAELTTKKAALEEGIVRKVSHDMRWMEADELMPSLYRGLTTEYKDAMAKLNTRMPKVGRAGALLVGGGIIYHYTQEEKVEDRAEPLAPGPVAEAPAEEEKVPDHISSQLDNQ